MLSYTYTLDREVVEGLLQLPARQRQELVRHFRSLADNPFQAGDARFKTPSGREIQKKRFGSWLISYWPDHPVKEVRVVGIQRSRS